MDALQLLTWSLILYLCASLASLFLLGLDRLAIKLSGITSLVGGVIGIISGMVSQLTCCSLVSVMVRVSVSRLFSSASAACGLLLIRQPVKPSSALNSKNGRCGIP